MSLRSSTILRMAACLTCSVFSVHLLAATLDPAPDTILLNGKVLTVDEDFTIAQAVAIKDGRFVGVGDDADVVLVAAAGDCDVEPAAGGGRGGEGE